jgi:prepilin-type processing-associated H-X9-DG protein
VPISFQCPHCGAQSQVDDQFAGQSGPCRGCGATVTIPGAPAGAATYPPRRSSGTSTLVVVAVVLAGGCLLGVPIMLALLLPAVQAAREAARRSQCTNNVKQIVLSAQEYADTFKVFPPVFSTDADGKPMQSWRVTVLPFLESTPVYDQYQKDEAWDGPINSQLAGQMPPMYRCPSNVPTAATNTDYAVIYGNGALFDINQPCPLASVRDGLSNTLMVVEASASNIHWMEPRDLDFSKMQCVINGPGGNEISSHHPGGAIVGFADGSARTISSSVSPAVLRALITRNGGEPMQTGY